MKTRILSKLFIFLMTTAVTAAGSSYGYSEAEQSIQSTVQPAVAIEKLSSSVESGTVTPQTGVHTGLKSVFSIKTNGNDDDYDFIINSKITTEEGDVSAYGQNGSILFGHTLALPTQSAIENAKIGGSNNKNVIAYPVSAVITDPMTVSFQNNYGVYGDCYVVKVNSAMDGTVTHTVNPNPVSGTYSVTQDQAGTYKSTVYFTAVSK